MHAAFDARFQSPERLGVAVVDLESLNDVRHARDIVEPMSPDDRAEPHAYLETIVATEEAGISHNWPVRVVGREALAVLVANAQAVAAERDRAAGRLAIAA